MPTELEGNETAFQSQVAREKNIVSNLGFYHFIDEEIEAQIFA